MPTQGTRPDPAQAASVLTRATLRASSLLGLSQKELGAILGISAAGMSRLNHGQRLIEAHTKEGELAVLFVRVFRSLDALLGGDSSGCSAWLRAENHHLQGVPLQLMQQVRGLVDVAGYLDAMRGKA